MAKQYILSSLVVSSADVRHAVFTGAITWDWIDDLLELVIPSGPPLSTAVSSPTPSAFTVLALHLTSCALMHIQPESSQAAWLSIGAVLLSANIMKDVKEQGMSVVGHSFELHSSKKSESVYV